MNIMLKKLFDQAEAGNARAQFELGLRLERGTGGLKRNTIEAAQWYLKAAEQGHAHAQFNLAYMYHVGSGVSKDEEKAEHWAKKSAAQGYELAQFVLA